MVEKVLNLPTLCKQLKIELSKELMDTARQSTGNEAMLVYSFDEQDFEVWPVSIQNDVSWCNYGLDYHVVYSITLDEIKDNQLSATDIAQSL